MSDSSRPMKEIVTDFARRNPQYTLRFVLHTLTLLCVPLFLLTGSRALYVAAIGMSTAAYLTQLLSKHGRPQLSMDYWTRMQLDDNFFWFQTGMLFLLITPAFAYTTLFIVFTPFHVAAGLKSILKTDQMASLQARLLVYHQATVMAAARITLFLPVFMLLNESILVTAAFVASLRIHYIRDQAFNSQVNLLLAYLRPYIGRFLPAAAPPTPPDSHHAHSHSE